MSTTWVLAADRAKARLFGAEHNAKSLVEIGDFLNPDARGRDLADERLPSTHDRLGKSRHAIEPHTGPQEKASAAFARRLDAVLERGRIDHRYANLVLIAPPQFLGALHEALGDQVRNCVVAEVPKDLTNANAQEILAQLPVLAR